MSTNRSDMDVIAKRRQLTGKINLLLRLLLSDEITLNSIALCNEWNFLKPTLNNRRATIMDRYRRELGPVARKHPIGLT